MDYLDRPNKKLDDEAIVVGPELVLRRVAYHGPELPVEC